MIQIVIGKLTSNITFIPANGIVDVLLFTIFYKDIPVGMAVDIFGMVLVKCVNQKQNCQGASH